MEHGLIPGMQLQEIMVEGSTFAVEVVKTGNRHAYARVREGKVIISIPSRMKDTEAERIAEDLYGKMKHSIERNPGHYASDKGLLHFNDGDTISTLGKQYTVKIHDCNARTGSSLIVGNEIRVFLPSHLDENSKTELAPYFVRMVLTKELKAEVIGRVNSINNAFFNSNIARVNITKADSRWGSCSRKRNADSYGISLNFKLLLLDEKLLEYVIVHELAHTKHLNHSKAFWNTVSSVLPDYRERKRSLKAIN